MPLIVILDIFIENNCIILRNTDLPGKEMEHFYLNQRYGLCSRHMGCGNRALDLIP